MLLELKHNGNWKPTQELPRLAGAKVLSFDTETYDPRLLTNGPGWATSEGYVVGVSVATQEDAWYVPLRNALGQGCPYGHDNAVRWLQDTLGTATCKVGANLTYDCGWLSTLGVTVGGSLLDVQHAEALLDDKARTGLDALGAKYVGAGKESSELYTWCAQTYGGNPGQAQRANIYRAPHELVGAYALADATLPLAVMQEQWPLLVEQNLAEVFDLECRLIPMLVAMRRQGVRVDVEKAEELHSVLLQNAEAKLHGIAKMAGREISVNSGKDLGFLCDKLGIKYPRTPTGKPQFKADWMTSHAHPAIAEVLETRKLLKLTGTFLKSYIIDGHTDGKLHGEFHQLRSDAGGAKTGRLSSSHPNLQNIPSRSELGKILRSLFIPFAGDSHWLKADYSQVEYRGLVHFAVGRGADAVRSEYLNDPRTDYHKLVQDLVKAMTGLDIARGPIKNINFGLLYGMGLKTLAAQLGIPFGQALEMYKAYHKGAPYVGDTMEAIQSEAQRQGYVETILGRRTRFPLWEPADGTGNPLPFDQAVRKYGSAIKRAYLYKALNYKLQGSAADLMKVAMVNGWESGLFHRFRLPSLTVHDELDISYNAPDTDPALLSELKRCMESAVQLRVPVIADMEVGTNWGNVEEVYVA